MAHKDYIDGFKDLTMHSDNIRDGFVENYYISIPSGGKKHRGAIIRG